MSQLSQSQVFFVLKSIGKEFIYTAGGTPGIDFNTNFLQDIQNPVSQIAIRLALMYQIFYDKNNNIIIGVAVSDPQMQVDQIRSMVEKVGMRIPNRWRSDPTLTLTYFQKFGHLYTKFNNTYMYIPGQHWSPNLSENSAIDIGSPDPRSSQCCGRFTAINDPVLNGYDIYLDVYLLIHLRDMFTDFDLFNTFSSLTVGEALDLDRPQLINMIVKAYNPAGIFNVSFGFSHIKLTWTVNEIENIYHTFEIKTIAQNGTLYFQDKQQSYVGLYQLAFLFDPEYIKYIYETELSERTFELANDIHQHLIQQIKIAETRQAPIRFSEPFAKFNQQL